MKKVNFYLTLFIGMVMALSCKENYEMEATSKITDTANQEVKLVNGVLHIPSLKHFRQITENLTKKRDKLDEFEHQFAGFISVRTAFSQLTDVDAEKIATNGLTAQYKGYVSVIGEGETKEITRTITDPILATLVNREGLLVIGNTAHKFYYDKFYMSNLQNNASRIDFNEKDAGVSIGRVTHGNALASNARGAASIHCLHEYWVGNNKRRLAGDIDYSEYYTNGALHYRNVTVYTKHQKRVLGTWWTMDTNSLSLTGSIKIHNLDSWETGIWGTQFTYSINHSCTDCGWLEESFGSNCPTGCAPTYTDINTSHSGQLTNGSWEGCNLSL